jgi:hypothetical protein
MDQIFATFPSKNSIQVAFSVSLKWQETQLSLKELFAESYMIENWQYQQELNWIV